jgi:hypothetical protein
MKRLASWTKANSPGFSIVSIIVSQVTLIKHSRIRALTLTMDCKRFIIKHPRTLGQWLQASEEIIPGQIYGLARYYHTGRSYPTEDGHSSNGMHTEYVLGDDGLHQLENETISRVRKRVNRATLTDDLSSTYPAREVQFLRRHRVGECG